jgi:predicted amidohydrolase
VEDHGSLIGGSSIVDPNGHIIVEAKTKEDELVYATIDLAMCRKGKGRVFAFDDHRRTEHYARLVEQVGVVEPDFIA